MKLTVLLLIVTFLQVSGKAFSQDVTYSGKNVSMETVLSVVKKQTGYAFFYRNKDLSFAEPVTVRLRNTPLKSALQSIFDGQPLSFYLQGKTIVVTKKEQRLLTSSSTFIAPTLHGKIVDSSGAPIPGVSIRVKNADKGTLSEEDGSFSLDVEKGKTIVISSIGFQTKELKVGDKDHVTIVLRQSKSELNQLLVVAYGTQNKASFTGSLSSLQSKTYEDAPKENVLQSMKGNLPGVMVSSGSGQPNSVGNVRIRGLGSINAGRGPLYVVDGVPSSVSVTGLSPDDIKSVTVLKDAAATSIYGSRAANGVVIITTKKGNSGKTKLNFSVLEGVNKMTVNQRQKLLNTSEMLELLKEGWVNAGKDPADWDQKVKSEGVDPNHNTDWFDELMHTGHFSKYHLSASGGSDNTQFYISGSYMQSYSPQKGDHYKRGNVMVSVNTQVKERLHLSGKLLGYYDKSREVPTGGSFASPIRAFYRLQPWIPIYNEDGSYNTGFNGTHNTVGELDLNRRPHTAFHGTAQGKAEYKILDGLTFESTEAISLSFDKGVTWYNPFFGSGRHNGGRRNVSTSHAKTWTTSNLLRYKHTFNSAHDLEIFGGYEAQKSYSEGLSVRGENFIPGLKWLSSASDPSHLESGNSANSLVGTFLNAHYNYKDNYFLSASFRRDGSSRFGSDKRYGNFWSIGAGWNIHNTLLNSSSFLSDLKLRVSYGTNGNQNIGDYEARGLYSSGHNYNGGSGFLLGQYANAFLTWELNKPFDVGVDFSLFNNRLYGTFDYYNRVTSRLLLSVPLPASTGLSSYMDNYGAMRNSGIEVSLSSKNIVKHRPNGLTWNTDFNISANRNEITKLPSPLTSSTYKREVGYNYYSFHLYAYAGVDPETGDALWYSSKDKSSTTNDFSKAVRLHEGNATPKFYGGLTNTFTYQRFTFSFMLYVKWGGKVYDSWGHDTNTDGHEKFSSTGKMSRYEYDHRWQKPGDQTDVPKIIYGNKTHSYSSSSRFLYDGSYIRLRDVTLSYSLPSSFSNTLKIDGASVFFRANNLLTFVKDKALIMDPEVYADGILDQYAPHYKTVTMGINIHF